MLGLLAQRALSVAVRAIRFQSIIEADVYLNLSPSRRHICPGRNTFLNGTGVCECNAQNPFGDPEDPKGCWNCDPICDANARCVDKDKCRCNEGFIGDGIESCEKPIPVIRDFFPKSGSSSGGDIIRFSIESPPGYVVVKAYCRFGPVVSEAVHANSTTLECLTQYNKPGSVVIAVGFDTAKWSQQQNTFLFVESSFGLFENIIVFALIVMSGLLGVSFIWFVRRKREYNEDQAYEVLPLTQWHMKAPEQISSASEKTFWQFLWDIRCN